MTGYPTALRISGITRSPFWLRVSRESNTPGLKTTDSNGHVPNEDHPGTCFLHKSGQFTCGLGRFMPVDWTPPAEVPDTEYPLVLSTGRRLYQYHTRTQTGRCEGINNLLGEETADISLQDASTMGIQPDEKIRVKSRRGEVIVKARVTPEVPSGLVWMAFHFRETCANWLTNPVFDPDTLTAEYKACAVQIEKL